MSHKQSRSGAGLGRLLAFFVCAQVAFGAGLASYLSFSPPGRSVPKGLLSLLFAVLGLIGAGCSLGLGMPVVKKKPNGCTSGHPRADATPNEPTALEPNEAQK